MSITKQELNSLCYQFGTNISVINPSTKKRKTLFKDTHSTYGKKNYEWYFN